MSTLGVTQAPPLASLTPGAPPDYFNIGNFANSPLPILSGAGPINAVSVGSGGTGYAAPVVVITDLLPGIGTGAVATAQLDATGAIIGYTLVNGGTGYTNVAVTITDDPSGLGSGATATATVSGGIITAISVVTPGSGYASPAVSFTDTMAGPGTGAAATATQVGGVITSIAVTAPGTGYIAPAVAITDSSGTGASATASIAVTFTGGIRKFMDSLPGLNSPNNLGQMIPVGVPDTITYPGSDYYEISLQEYSEKMHTDLPATKLRGYVQTNFGTNAGGQNTIAPASIHYLGPMIVAQRDRPVRIKFTNNLPTTALGGDLFIPVDTTVMGAGMGPNGNYPQNRATLHLHGGNTPWISDGTPHQWTTPAGEGSYPKGVSVQNVPDMPDPGPGSLTFFYSNQQSARLMFYHDHAYGITRLNVYAGEAAGYVLTDPAEQTLVSGGTINGVSVNPGSIPANQIPLIIQDKTFVPDTNPGGQLAAQDPTWDVAKWGGAGNLWFPHIYMPNQDPSDNGGANAFGRWDYGPWFWPPMDPSTLQGQPTQCISNGVPITNANTGLPVMCPGTPTPSLVPEAFMDTPVINGTVYPYVDVQPQAYRLRILNAANDRTLNLQLYVADPTVTTADFRTNTEVKMVPAVARAGWPATWPTDGRDGGVPDPTTVGPDMIQIGTEAGFLPTPVRIKPTPIGYNYNRRDIVVLNIADHALLLGPAERADVIVDFSAYGGKTLILYNDAPAPVPAFDARFDYYTGDMDQTATGGAPTTQAGYGPNTRTMMQIRVAPGTGTPFNLAALQAALPVAYAASQPAPLVPEKAYDKAFNTTTAQDTYSRIQDTALTFTPPGSPTAVTMPITRKAIQELFELDYGRMNAILGVELPLSNFTTQTTIPYFYIDPPTEVIKDGETQLWKITHNGVDTHAIHFHLFNVQLINRVGWDGAIRPPDANEVGWKETVRMNPLEDAIVALKPMKQNLPWPLPDSIRLTDVTRTLGASGNQYTNVDPNNNPSVISNQMTNFGWEYVWHCHLLGHEENDMMRPIVFQVPPEAPSNLQAFGIVGNTVLTWIDNSASETGFTLQKATDPLFTQNASTFSVPASAGKGLVVTYRDTIGTVGRLYYYQVRAENTGAYLNGYTGQTQSLISPWSNIAQPTASPVAGVSLTALTFADQLVNTTSAAQTVTLSNTGTAPLTIISIGNTGTNPGDFSQTNNCGNSLAAGGTCTLSVTFKPTAIGVRAAAVTINSNDPVSPTLTVSLSGSGIAAMTQALRFVPIAPCRVVDTRKPNGPLAGPRLAIGARSFPILSGTCGLPATARAYALNVTVVPPSRLGYLTIWPTGQTQPVVSTLNSLDGRVKANAAIVPAGTGGAVSVYVTDPTHVLIDVAGYFVPVTAGANLMFYSLPSCRVADTRSVGGVIAGAQSRDFTVAGICGVPSGVSAYSLNFTAVPKVGQLGYITAFPAGTTKPVASTLNAPTGAITANAGIVPAGTAGAISVFASDATDLIIDVNGYFAPPGGASALSFYALAPCRVVDTRKPAGALGGPALNGQRDLPLNASTCGIPTGAQAYSLNATVVPPARLGYLTLWPWGSPKPAVSTLNAMDGAITSNAAIVAAANGEISAFTSDLSNLILDINGYFAP